MKKDNRAGIITVNPKLLEKKQNDPEAAKKYTQTWKDIGRAEKTEEKASGKTRGKDGMKAPATEKRIKKQG